MESASKRGSTRYQTQHMSGNQVFQDVHETGIRYSSNTITSQELHTPPYFRMKVITSKKFLDQDPNAFKQLCVEPHLDLNIALNSTPSDQQTSEYPPASTSSTCVRTYSTTLPIPCTTIQRARTCPRPSRHMTSAARTASLVTHQSLATERSPSIFHDRVEGHWRGVHIKFVNIHCTQTTGLLVDYHRRKSRCSYHPSILKSALPT